ncbi:MAG TPA: hypothetical protein VNT99_08355 [Methylomirabilota bacterium]|nr:hypothetical protein [Methylomirabilota bacterium]
MKTFTALHRPDCDVNDINPDGIKPCNCSPFLAVDEMYASMAARLDKFCTCETCGARKDVDPVECLRTGWPKCCGETMTLGALATFAISADRKSIMCRRCGLTSYNSNDVEQRYCGNCHAFHK